MANVFNTQLGITETNIATGGTVPRNILSIRLVNTDTAARTFSLYVYPSGGSASDTTIIKKEYSIASYDDYYFTKDELLRLGDGEVFAGIADVAAKITVTINYEDK